MNETWRHQYVPSNNRRRPAGFSGLAHTLACCTGSASRSTRISFCSRVPCCLTCGSTFHIAQPGMLIFWVRLGKLPHIEASSGSAIETHDGVAFNNTCTPPRFAGGELRCWRDALGCDRWRAARSDRYRLRRRRDAWRRMSNTPSCWRSSRTKLRVSHTVVTEIQALSSLASPTVA